jgi:hypothetical protein
MNMLKQKRHKWLREASQEALKGRSEGSACTDAEDIPF